MKSTVDIHSFKLRNRHGACATIINFGARLTSLYIPSAHHGMINTVLGYDNPQAYLNDSMYHGAMAGRYCNRIENGKIQLRNQNFFLPCNDGQHHLHGGPEGFDKQYWQAIEVKRQSLHLRLLSADGDAGYPGNLCIDLYFVLDDSNQLTISWKACSDKDTFVCLTNHSYFNLAASENIYNHYLRIPADHYTPVNRALIPTGELKAVADSIFDVRRWTHLGDTLTPVDPELQETNGFDHNWARGNSGQLQTSAELYSPDSELLLHVSSTLPGLQCYTGNNLSTAGVHTCHEGICLETQHYPNSPNQPHFPSAQLTAGHCVQHQTCFAFTTRTIEDVIGTIEHGVTAPQVK
jgi:aldose 1-epimerase